MGCHIFAEPAAGTVWTEFLLHLLSMLRFEAEGQTPEYQSEERSIPVSEMRSVWWNL